MTPPTAGLAQPRLLRISSGQAWKMVDLGIVAIPVGALVTVLGGVLLVGFVLGPLLIIGGLVAILLGLLQAIDPTRHQSIRPLGRTAQERVRALRAIEESLPLPGSLHVPMTRGNMLSVTAHWLVIHGRDLVIAHRDDVLWAYMRLTTRKLLFIPTGRTLALCLRTRRADKEEVTVTELEEERLLAVLRQAVPHAFVGYNRDLDRIPRGQLASLVDARRAQLAQPVPGSVGPRGHAMWGRARLARPESPPCAPGRRASGGATVPLSHSAVEGNRGVGVYLANEATSVALEDLVVRDTCGQASDGTLGLGLLVAEGAGADLSRALFERNRLVGVAALDAGTTLAAANVVVARRPSAWPSAWAVGLWPSGRRPVPVGLSGVDARRPVGLSGVDEETAQRLAATTHA